MNGSTHNHMPVPDVWNVRGNVFENDGATPFTQGLIYVYCLHNGNEHQIAQTGLDHNGFFTLTFSKDQFQFGDVSKSTLDAKFKIRDYSGNLLWEYGVITIDDPEYEINPLLGGTIVSDGSANPNPPVDPNIPEPPGDGGSQNTNMLRASGTISNTLGYPVSGCTVVVKGSILSGGRFNETELARILHNGQPPASQGTYDISFHTGLATVLGTLDEVRFVIEVYTKNVSGEDLKFVGKSDLLKAEEGKIFADFVIDTPSNADISTFTNTDHQLSDNGFAEESIIELASSESKLKYAAERTGVSIEELFAVALAESILATLRHKLDNVNDAENIPDKVNRQVMYALVKTRNVNSFQDLTKITAATLQTVLVSAITQSIISPSVQNDLSDIVSEWRVIYAILLREDAQKNNAGRIFKHIMQHNEFSAHYQTVTETYAENAHDLEKFWSELTTKLSENNVPPATITNLVNKIKFFFDIHKFADEFGPLSDAMMAYADTRGFVTIEDFIRLDKPDEWLHGVIGRIEDFTINKKPEDRIEWPEFVPGESDREKRSNYATILYNKIIALFPKVRFNADMTNAINNNSTNYGWWQSVKAFLDARPSFDFANAITEDDINYNSALNKEQKEALYDKLLTVQRLYRLTPKFEVIDGLIKNGLTSAMSVAHINTDEFAKNYSDVVGGIDDAQALHAAAVHTASQALFLMGTFNQQTDLPQTSIPAVTERFTEPVPQSITPMSAMSFNSPSPMNSGANNVTNNTHATNETFTIKPVIPNIATLFGNQNQCLCEDCQSVFSPSAYMVDLLEFLNDEVRGELFSRRPDLAETDLSCMNTNGAVAYIDLVNEVLENAVCPRQFNIADNGFFSSLAGKTNEPVGSMPSAVMNEFTARGFYIDKDFTVQRIKDVADKLYIVGDRWRYLVESLNSNELKITPFPQTGKDAQSRRAKPEHTHRGAYEILKTPSYPANLPFNLSFVEVNEFLKLKNTNRRELYYAMRGESGALDPVAEMLAHFEMTDVQKNLIIANNNTEINTKVRLLWGFAPNISNNELLNSLGNAEAVIKKLNIPLETFFDLMRTNFVFFSVSPNHPYLDWGDGHAYENGELDKLILKNCTPAVYFRMACLQRLSGHLGLDVVTADKLLSIYAAQSVNADVNVNTAAGFFANLKIDDNALVALSKYLQVANEFAVSPIRAATWMCNYTVSADMRQYLPNRFEELFYTAEFRIADFSNALGVSVSEFHKLQSIVQIHAQPCTADFLIECRSLLATLKRFKISIDEFQNLLLSVNVIEDSQSTVETGFSFLTRTLNIAAHDAEFITGYMNEIYGFDVGKLETINPTPDKYKSLAALFDMCILNGVIPFRNRDITIFDLLLEIQKCESIPSFVQIVTRAVDWPHEDVSKFVEITALSLGELKKIETLKKLNRMCGLLRKVGLTALFADSLISVADNSPEQSEILIDTLKITYTQSQWIDVAEPIRNNIRRRQRNALCAYLLANGFVNRAAISARFLIDVEMDVDVKTTRIVQANSSIQTLLQRALLNFERITLDDKIKQQWSWMKNYRLWEANRKIFLYPENWVEPEFRDDKTPLFKELESAILQKELNPPNIGEAFKAYATGLSEVANLEVIGAYSEDGAGGKILHVIGRTFHYPHSYYYRKNHDVMGGLGYWTPWEKIDLDITADVVLPIPFRNKIYIFWPLIEVKEKAVPNDKEANKFEDSFKYYEIKLAWSEFFDGKWSAKRISQNAYLHFAENIDNDLIKPTDLFHFKAEVRFDDVEIQVFAYKKTIETIVKTKTIKHPWMRSLFFKKRTSQIKEIYVEESDGIFKIAAFTFGADNNARLISVDDKRNYMDHKMIPPGTDIRHNRAEESDANQNSGNYGAFEYPKNNVLFKQTPERFICFPTNLAFFDNIPAPFFLRLNEKTLFIKPTARPSEFSLASDAANPRLDTDSTTYFQAANFYHPLADDIVRRANRTSIDDLLNRSVQANARDQYPLGYAALGDEHAAHLADLSFQHQYLPQQIILGGYPAPTNDFSTNGAFGVYNWELFFHLPMYIATRLSRDNQYEEAMRWFHYIFNPACDFTTWEKTQRWTWDLPNGARFWNFLPFFANRGVKDSIYKAVEKSQIPDQDTKLGCLIEDWKNDPFKPHLIARIRVAAYQKAVVMRYLDNLIKWGDSLFRLDNMESINEATQLYTQASEVLGDRPVLVPKLHEMPGLTYTQLKAEGLDQFSNTVIQLENYIPPPPPIKVRFWRAKQAPSRYYYYHYNYNYSYNASVEAIPHRSVQLLRMAPALHYFCIPRNERLMSYWHIVEDRLFKIRHSMNIDGVKRVMPLFAPPIDPGMLARAASMGISISEIFANAQDGGLTPYRYSVVFQKAQELCNELKSFGSELLSALEKRDGERLSMLRNNHEIELLKLIKNIKRKSVEESKQNLEALLKTRAVTEERHNYYKELERINENESLQLAASRDAATLNTTGQVMMLAAGPMSLLPDALVGALIGAMGGPIAAAEVSGGEKNASSIQRFANALIQSAGIFDRTAGILGTTASYDRRWNEWKLQERLAQKELAQIDKQILCAEIRLQIAENDLDNHDRQTEQSESLKEVMNAKFTNENLYQWMADELNNSYAALYNIAYKAAKNAECAFQFELGNKDTFVESETWSSARNGLLAGNRLSVQLREMDTAYVENNKREIEITKAISLCALAPEELLRLRETGSCNIDIPEIIYDFDCPGQYFRRIKSVRVTIPCVAGPYTNISAKLTLLNSKIRADDTPGNRAYQMGSENLDDRFLHNPIPVGGTSISTSNAMMDSGMFEFNFRDERYLPFEGAGAISKWELKLPEYRQFNYNSITDVVLHVSYTARESTDTSFKNSVVEYLDAYLEEQKFIPNLISLNQSFRDQFNLIVGREAGEVSLNDDEHHPHLIVDYWKRKNINSGRIPPVDALKIFVLLKNNCNDGTLSLRVNDNVINKNLMPRVKLYGFEFENIGSLSINLKLDAIPDDAEIEDIFLYFGYTVV